ncbi:MAG: cobT [Frankiales bacterium]|nr:cobT [Frankiales bacterium]
MSRLDDELRRVFGDPPQHPRAVMRVQVGDGHGLEAGQDEADRFVDAGADLVVLDGGPTTPASLAAIAVYLALEPVGVVGTTASEGWKERVLAVRELLRDCRSLVGDPARLLESLGDPALGRLVGLLDRLSSRRTAVVLGGATTTVAAALVASHLQPGADSWWIAGSQPVEQAGVAALASIGLTPLLDLGLGEGSADVAVAVVRKGLEQLGA